MFVKPAEGLRIRDPNTLLPLPSVGREVPEDAFWLLLERHGDVVRAEPPGTEPPLAEPLGAEPLGAEPLGAEPGGSAAVPEPDETATHAEGEPA